MFRIVAWAARRRTLVCAGLACLIAASAFGATRLTFDSDVLSLLPRDGRVIPAFRDYLARVGSLDQLYVQFTAPDGQAIGDYEDEIDAWIEALRDAPEIDRVDSGVADGSRDFQWLADRRLLLLRGEALEQGLARLSGPGLQTAVSDSRGLLSAPSPSVVDLVRNDPLGLFGLLRQTLGGAQSGINIGITEGGYISPDGRSRLVMARPRRPPFDTEFAHALEDRLAEIRSRLAAERDASAETGDEPLPPLEVVTAGGHRVAVETERQVKQESILNTVGSLALILPLLFLVYRSVWLVVFGALPSAVSLLVVLGMLGMAGVQLSAAATGAAAMLFGLGVDGVVLLYVAYLLRTSADDNRDIPERLAGPSSSMLLGMWTTAATFYGLTFVDFPSLQQLGRLIGHSMLACGVLTLILVPALLPRKPSRKQARSLTLPKLAAWTARHRTAIVVGAVVATIGLGAVASRLRIDPTLDRLRSATDAARLELEIGQRFGLPDDVFVVLSDGPDLDALLTTNERLADRVRTELPGMPFQPPSQLVPSAATQRTTAARIAQSGATVDSVRGELERAREAAGFKPGVFDPFADRLPELLDTGTRLGYDDFVSHGLGDLVQRLIVKGDRWTVVTYAFPREPAEADRLQQIVDDVDPAQTLTGISLVNRELAARFAPQFYKGLAIGSAMVIVLVLAAFRNLRLAFFALLPTIIGLVWTAGILALTGVQLDLFAMFAVVTFLGIGVDYGVHLVHRYQEHGDAQRATSELAPVILVAGAITLLGYGTLVNSSYPPLRSIGVVSAVSVAALAAASVLVLPALLNMRRQA